MRIIKYTHSLKDDWDDFVKDSKNSHFFFYRDYMEYHSDRFLDFSLIILDQKEKIVALLPANIKDNVLYSHQGLTFGGFLINDKMKTETMLEVFETLREYSKKENIQKIIYKCMPYIYHILPSEEDSYSLFRNDAKLFRRDVTTTIYLSEKIKYQEQRKRAVKKAVKNNLIFEESKDFRSYWGILEATLNAQHGARPVHTVDEIENLVTLFPENIKLFLAKKENVILGGVLVFENTQIVHTQYLANSIIGRDVGALDFVIDKLINEIYKDKKYFDFGISNENDGRFLNTGLIAQKEGFGARAIVHDFYELEIK